MSQRLPGSRSRPKNRKAMILAAASELFYRRGYAAVGMSDIALAVDIAPSALYRHFASKNDLLKAVVEQSLSAIIRPIEQLKHTADTGSPEVWAKYFAEVAIDSRQAGVLWRRESRRLAPEDIALLQNRLAFIRAELAARVRVFRPETGGWAELLARAQLSIFASISFHRVELPREYFVELLSELVLAVGNIELPDNSQLKPLVEAERERDLSTRERLLAVAAELFAKKGYASVGIGELAAAVGIAGPSVYHHFASKVELLYLSLEQAAAQLREALNSALAEANDAVSALDAVMVSYLRMILREPHLILLLITELDHLADQQKAVILSEQQNYVSQWVALLRKIDPGISEQAAWVRAQACITVFNERLGGQRDALRSGEIEAIVSICRAILFEANSGRCQTLAL